MQSPESAVSAFGTQFYQVLYNEPNSIVQMQGQLSALTGTFLNPTYTPGQLLAQLSNGQFVNYSAAGSSPQNVAVAILTQQWVNTAGGDGGYYIMASLKQPLAISGAQLALANESADITGFVTEWSPQIIPAGSTLNFNHNGTPDAVYQL